MLKNNFHKNVFFFFRFGANAGVRDLGRSDGPEGGLRRGVDERSQVVAGGHRVSFFFTRSFFFFILLCACNCCVPFPARTCCAFFEQQQVVVESMLLRHWLLVYTATATGTVSGPGLVVSLVLFANDGVRSQGRFGLVLQVVPGLCLPCFVFSRWL